MCCFFYAIFVQFSDKLITLISFIFAVKKKYQLRELSNEDLIFAMKSMCRDIEEFITTLYNNTELKEERDLITMMLNNVISVTQTF